jgi:hypothetical protein
MIPLPDPQRKPDGSRWKARPGFKGLRTGIIYRGLGPATLPHYRWVEVGNQAKCVHESDLELVAPLACYRLRPEYACLEFPLDPQRIYFTVEEESPSGYVVLLVDGNHYTADVTLFDKLDSPLG